VLFVDKPDSQSPAGLWGVGLDGGAPALFTDRLGQFSRDLQYRVYPRNQQTIVERLADGQEWVIPSEGRSVSLSPDGSMVAWTAGQSGPPFDTARREIWVSQIDGSQARPVRALVSGGFAGWLPGGRILVSGNLEPPEEGQAFWAVSLNNDSDPVEIARAPRLRGSSLSPDGSWLAYQVAFTGDPAQNGLWLANTQTAERFRLDLFGAYRWRDGSRLLVIPLDLASPTHRLWQVQAGGGQPEPLTDPSVTPFKVANGDWSVSPDGQHIVFVSAADHNLWLLTGFPDPAPSPAAP
jgi:Tol biopolymer transport system component